MRYSFRCRTSPTAAAILSAEQRQVIVRNAVAMVDRMEPYHRALVILNENATDLKVIVRFAEQEIHIMTVKEAEAAGIKIDPHEPSEN